MASQMSSAWSIWWPRSGAQGSCTEEVGGSSVPIWPHGGEGAWLSPDLGEWEAMTNLAVWGGEAIASLWPPRGDATWGSMKSHSKIQIYHIYCLFPGHKSCCLVIEQGYHDMFLTNPLWLWNITLSFSRCLQIDFLSHNTFRKIWVWCA